MLLLVCAESVSVDCSVHIFVLWDVKFLADIAILGDILASKVSSHTALAINAIREKGPDFSFIMLVRRFPT